MLPRIAVASPSFSKNAVLREALTSKYNAVFHESSTLLSGDALRQFIHAHQATGVIIGREVLDRPLIHALSGVKLIAKYGVGLDSVDLDALEDAGIALGWTGGVNAMAVAEHTLGLILASVRHIYRNAAALKAGHWIKNGGDSLSTKTIGIIGVGHTGKALATVLRPFQCRILACDCLDQTAYYHDNGLEAADHAQVFRESDIISLHVPLNASTRYLVNQQTLGLMKPTAYLINTSRGEVVDTDALTACIQANQIAGAAIDVYETEPYTGPLLADNTVIGTPHTAGNSTEAVLAMGQATIDALDRFFKVA